MSKRISSPTPSLDSLWELFGNSGNAQPVLDTMLTSLVDILEKKGIVTQEEWEQEIKKRLKT
jgi:hypothetical protein